MKRVGFLYDQITDETNIRVAIQNSSKGKRRQKRIQRVMNEPDRHIRAIRRMLINKTYVPSPYIERTIHDNSAGKQRTIHKPRYYPDQIIHWALMQVIQPIIMRGMYRYCCGSVPGRGTADGQRTLRRWLDRDYKGTRWCLKMDIRKFYPSVDNETLKSMFRRKIKCQSTLWLIDSIIDSADGLPIGNFTSQWFSNFYLEGLDHHVKQQLRVPYYIRYVDDLVLLGPNKRKLHRAKRDVDDYLAGIHLSIKGNWQVFRPNDRAIDFLGLRFYRTHTSLRKRNALRIRRRVRRIAKKGHLSYRDAAAVISYWGWIKRSDSYEFYHEHIKPCVTIKQARKAVSVYDRLRNHSERSTGEGEQGPSRS